MANLTITPGQTLREAMEHSGLPTDAEAVDRISRANKLAADAGDTRAAEPLTLVIPPELEERARAFQKRFSDNAAAYPLFTGFPKK